MMNEKRKLSYLYLLGLLIPLIMFLFFGRRVYTHLLMEYAEDPTGDAIVSVYDGEGLLGETLVEDGCAELYFWCDEIREIAPIHYQTHEDLYLTELVICIHGYEAVKIFPEEFPYYFGTNQAVESLEITDQGAKLRICGENPALQVNEILQQRLSVVIEVMSLLNLLFFILIYTILFWYFFKILDLMENHEAEDFLDAFLGVAALVAILISWNIAFTSAYGGTIHPDEMQTRAAVEYYQTHWIQPDVRSDFVADTVSGYGMTRLSEINLYYLFAGKFTNLCGFEMGFRGLGMLLFLILGCFILKNVKKNRFMAILFFATPQLWYLYSYATSDAYDYLFAVLAIYEILAEKSALNRIFNERFHKKQIFSYLGVGFVFANLLMAKKTFYLVLVTAFLLLLYRLIFSEKHQRKDLFTKYLGILLVVFSVVLIRYIPDFGYYGLNKSAAVDQVIEETALPEYKPSTPAADQARSTLLYEKGVTLKEFFTEWDFNKELLDNYFGYYGIYSLRANDWYYCLMRVLYLMLFISVGILVHRCMYRERLTGSGVVRKCLVYWTMWGMIGLMYLLSIYNAYFVDFQPQGRYLFPALPALACQIGLYKEVQEHKIVKGLIAVIALLSLYSFYKIAYLNF